MPYTIAELINWGEREKTEANQGNFGECKPAAWTKKSFAEGGEKKRATLRKEKVKPKF